VEKKRRNKEKLHKKNNDATEKKREIFEEAEVDVSTTTIEAEVKATTQKEVEKKVTDEKASYKRTK